MIRKGAAITFGWEDDVTATPEPVLPASRRPMPTTTPPPVPAEVAKQPKKAKDKSGTPPPPRSPDEIQREMAETRQRLAETIDEIVDRTHPRNVTQRAKARLRSTVLTPEGNLRLEIVGGVVGALVAVTALTVWARRRRPRRLEG